MERGGCAYCVPRAAQCPGLPAIIVGSLMRRIPDDNLAYPVLVTAGPSAGSGFFLKMDRAIFLVTARHVLIDPTTGSLRGPTGRLVSYSKDPADRTSRNVIDLDLAGLFTAGELKSDASKDVAVIRIATRDPTTDTGKTIAGAVMSEHTPAGLLSVAKEAVGLYDHVMVANDTYTFGYPVSLGIPNMPQIDATRPLIRRGIVAGKHEARRTILLDTPVYPGNSGGPVMEVEQVTANEYQARIIGVVLEFVPSLQNGVMANSGYTVVASMDDVMALVHTF